MAKLALAVYRGEADHRQGLFMQGQDTLVTIGMNEDDVRVGAGTHLKIPMGGDAKYIGVNSEGLKERRETLQLDKARLAQQGGQILDTSSRERESGESLKVRVSAQTATLTEIALTGAGGLQEILRTAAEWMGEDPEAVTITPNLDFVAEGMTGKGLSDLMTAKMLGAPISMATIHSLMVAGEMTEKEFEEEMALLLAEEPILDTGTDAGGNPDDEE